MENCLPFLSEKENMTVLSAYIQPGAGKSGLAGIFQDRLKIRICAPPVEGQANKQCVVFLSKMLGVAKTEIKLIQGEQSRRKTFVIARPGEFVLKKLRDAGLECA